MRESDLDAAADRLIDEANEAGGRDNITVVLFRLEEVGGDGAGDEPTMVGMAARALAGRAPRPTAAPAAVTASPMPARPRRRGGPSHSATGPHSRPQAAIRHRRPARRKPRRFTKPLAALLATVIVLFSVGGGGYLATRQLLLHRHQLAGHRDDLPRLALRPAVRDPPV